MRIDYIIVALIVIIILIILLSYKNKYNIEKFYNNSKPCDNNLSDSEYLKHMIPHHQVAIDISIMLQKKTKNPFMQHIIRKLIWNQNYEIILMKEMLYNLPNNLIQRQHNRKYISTVGDFVKPNKIGLTNTYCDPHFFDAEKHRSHLKHINLNDQTYLQHMIPHHQVAVDMSKKLLKNTNNSFMIYLAYRIIRSQQEEIILLNNLKKKNNYRYQSSLLNT